MVVENESAGVVDCGESTALATRFIQVKVLMVNGFSSKCRLIQASGE